ncbi:MAG TPA: lipid-A-disaccharide synthase [Gammaproteobacteria bacterium]|nr:lipid-A-disaccharide synthase [Gammaproteobacteria bacterium]
MRIGLIAGEPSGDLLGAGLVREIRHYYPDAEFCGIGGPAMLAEGVSGWVPMERLSIMGLAEVLRHLPELLGIRRHVTRRFAALRPDVVVGIDSPDFTLGVERRLRTLGIRTVHYVSPSIWAWRAGRINGIGRAADTVLCLLPFEPGIYAQQGIPAVFVGHPMADAIPFEADRDGSRAALGIRQGPGAREVVALLPGSRMSEVERLGAPFAAAAALLAARHPGLRFVAPMASARIRTLFASQLAEHAPGVQVQLFDGRSREVMAGADLVVLASGTATLEAALLKRPMVVAYRFSAASAWILRAFNLVKARLFALPNLLAGEMLVPELIQEAANAERIAAEATALLNDAPRRAALAGRFMEMHHALRRGADRRAAQAVLALADRLPEPLA